MPASNNWVHRYNDVNNRGLEVQAERFGYQIVGLIPLKHIKGFLYKLVHSATGTRHLHISIPDKENAFGVTFKTVPADSNGVAHILEHTVLCGSQKYPVRNPFFSLRQRSLNTFMDAFTSSDWTMYPFATQNAKDYFNLLDVYLDAVFFPNIDELSFKQEGHRLEFENLSRTNVNKVLVYKGVVYNEMKGAMSSPDLAMALSIFKALYPDTTYRNNAGGDPKYIPRLTHARLKAFHQRYYHPGNALFYTYGDLPLDKHLEFIDKKIMTRFEAIDPDSDVPMQPRWSKPKSVRYTYALAPSENPSHKYQVCLAWLVSDICDSFDVLVLTVLEQILLGNAASPLRKALMDSRLGSALSDATGFDANNRDTLFACGLKDTCEVSADEIEQIIFDVFHQLAENGIDRDMIDAAIDRIEFERKEITNSPYPYGIKLLLTVIGSWRHGGDPERILQIGTDLNALKNKIEAGPFLESCIQRFFIDNPHRIRMVLAPDRQKTRKEEKRVSKELKKRLAKFSPSRRNRINQEARALQTLRTRYEDISCLPTLQLTDICADVPGYSPTATSTKVPLWSYAQPTSGIFYFQGTAGAAVPSDLLAWVPFFCYAFIRVGTEKRDFSQISKKNDSVTGGFFFNAHSHAPWNQPQVCLPLITLKAKCLARNTPAMLDHIEELIGSVVFTDLERIKQLLDEYQAGLESMIVHRGHRLAVSLSSRSFSPSAQLSEIWGGLHQLHTIRDFSRQSEPAALDALSHKLAAISQTVFQPDNFIMAIVGEADQIDDAAQRIAAGQVFSSFHRDLQLPQLSPLDLEIQETRPWEGWPISATVAFVAKTWPTVPLGHPDAPALAVFSKIMHSLYLHREIREKGGAYGCLALYNQENGLFSIASYRDPHITRTLNVFDAVHTCPGLDSLKQADLTPAILQLCSEIDKPDPPGLAAQKAFLRLIIGLKDEERIKFKQQLLQIKLGNILEVVDHYFNPERTKSVTTLLAGENQLKQAVQGQSEDQSSIHYI